MVEFWKPRLVPSCPAEQVQASSERFPTSECSPRASCYLEQGAGGSCLEIAPIYAQAQFQSFCFLVRVLAYKLPSSAGSSIFSAFSLSTGMLRHSFSHFAFWFRCQLISYPHRRAQACSQLFCSWPVCSGVFSAILLFVHIGNNSGKAIMRHVFVEKEPSLLIMNIDRS